MTILHGDDRIYNNIFVQKYPVTDPSKTPADADYQVVGTACFDIFPTYEEWIKNFKLDEEPNMGELATYHFGHLPVWVDGNAYFGDCNVYAKEAHNLVHAAPVELTLKEENGEYSLVTNLYEALGDFRDGLMHTDLLGTAFEPEQRFENPDGTPILFDSDFFGAHRGISTVPGPFAQAPANTTIWKD